MDSKEDWAARFAAIHRVEEAESDEEEEGVDEEGVTMREEREAKWKEENEGREMEAGDKVAMRAYYKVSDFPFVWHGRGWIAS